MLQIPTGHCRAQGTIRCFGIVVVYPTSWKLLSWEVLAIAKVRYVICWNFEAALMKENTINSNATTSTRNHYIIGGQVFRYWNHTIYVRICGLMLNVMRHQRQDAIMAMKLNIYCIGGLQCDKNEIWRNCTNASSAIPCNCNRW